MSKVFVFNKSADREYGTNLKHRRVATINPESLVSSAKPVSPATGGGCQYIPQVGTNSSTGGGCQYIPRPAEVESR